MPAPGVVRNPFAQQVQVTHHRRQWIVEVVRHAARELDYGFNFSATGAKCFRHDGAR